MKIQEFVHNDKIINEAFNKKWATGALAAGALMAAPFMGGHKSTQADKPVAHVSANKEAPKSPAINKKSLAVLAQTMWGEARGYGRDGMEAIGSVILNRAKDVKRARTFGKGIIGVALKPKQFSCWNPGDPNRERAQLMKKISKYISEKKSPTGEPFEQWLKKFKDTGDYLDYKKWRLAHQVAEDLLKGKVKDPTGGATHYHASYVHPNWASSLDKVKQLDSHIFYRMPKTSSGE